jgi:L-fuculose-phosphate aldolase
MFGKNATLLEKPGIEIKRYGVKVNMDYLKKYKVQVDDFLKVCRRLSELLYVTSHGGNLASRVDDNLLLITPTKMNKAEVTAQDVVFINLSGQKISGRRAPTGETPMYLNFFRERPDIDSVIHCHPPYTSVFAITKGKNWLMRPIFPETAIEVGPVPVVPYAEPLTEELAGKFLPYIKKYNAFLMENHGLVMMSGEGITRAMQLIEILETTSISILQALSIGDVKEIPRKEVQNLDNTMKTRNLPLIGAPGVNSSLLDVYFSGLSEK